MRFHIADGAYETVEPLLGVVEEGASRNDQFPAAVLDGSADEAAISVLGLEQSSVCAVKLGWKQGG